MDRTLSETSCPRCDRPLLVGSTSDATVLLCEDCGGMWLDNPASVRVFELLDAPTLDVARSADSNAANDAVDDSPSLCCPICSEPMTRAEHRDAPVVVDTCASDGTWLDRGELVRIAEAIAARRGETLVLPAREPETTAMATEGSSVGETSLAEDIGSSVVGEIGADIGGGLLDAAFSLIGALLG